MKINQQFFDKIDHKIIILFSFILFSSLSFIYLNSFDDYYDDWNFFFTVDANITDEENWQRHYHGDRGDGGILKEAYPWVFTYITKYLLKIIGYNVENTHYILLFFSILSIIIFYNLSDLITKNIKFKIIVLVLFSLNLFLIRELNSFRPHSPTLFLSLLSSFYYIKFFVLKLKEKKNLIIYFLSTISMLTLWPQSVAIFAGQIVFAIIFLNLKIIFLLSLIFFCYIFLNLDYLIYLSGGVGTGDFGYTPLELKFFTNYFFRTFFGSIIFGAFMLILFSFFLIKKIMSLNIRFNLKFFIKSRETELTPVNYLLVVILSIYSVGITYSLLKTSIMAPKYFIPLLPLIILWIGYYLYLTKNNFLFFCTIFLAFINCVIFWKDVPIDRPPMREALKIIYNEDKNIKQIFTTERPIFNHFLSNYRFTQKNNFIIKELKKFSEKNIKGNFAILCLNNPRFAVGDLNLEDDEKCIESYKRNNFILIKTTKIDDFMIHFIKYNKQLK